MPEFYKISLCIFWHFHFFLKFKIHRGKVFVLKNFQLEKVLGWRTCIINSHHATCVLYPSYHGRGAGETFMYIVWLRIKIISTYWNCWGWKVAGDRPWSRVRYLGCDLRQIKWSPGITLLESTHPGLVFTREDQPYTVIRHTDYTPTLGCTIA